jgi:hypothetical protein
MSIRAALVGGILGLAAAAAVVYLLGNLWSSCGLGINAAANSMTLLYLYAPVVVVIAGPAAAAAFSIVERRGAMFGYLAAVAVAVVVAGLALFVGSDFGDDYPCPVLRASG